MDTYLEDLAKLQSHFRIETKTQKYVMESKIFLSDKKGNEIPFHF